MQTRTRLMMTSGFLLLCALAASGFALHYKILAEKLQEKWRVARTEARDLQRQLEAANAKKPESGSRVTPLVVEKQDNTEALEARIQELKAALKEKDRVVYPLQNQATNHPPAETRSRRDGRARLDELRKEDPKRYEEIMARREEARQRADDALARRAAHFLDRDTADMTKKEQDAYNLMLQLLCDTQQLADALRTELSRDQRREIWQELRGKTAMLEPMMLEERNKEFYYLGLESGYNEDEAAVFVDYLNELIDLTSPRGVYQGMRRGP